MTEEKQVNELAWKTRIHYDSMIDRGFTAGQITIMNIMISISQYSQEKGPGAAIAMMTACLNAIMSGGDVDVTKIRGFEDIIVRKKGGIPEEDEEEIEIDFDSEMDLSFGNDTEELDENINDENVIHVDFERD
tara:strand:+ start:50 stop:448 length:399 start_codon:yes stop_codon:yes gene_type:complete